MPKKKAPHRAPLTPTSVEHELAELKERLEEMGATVEELATMKDDIAQLREALRIRNPKLPSAARAKRARNAEIARASKEVGRGKGAVSSLETKKRLEQQAFGTQKPTKAQATKKKR